MNHGQYTGKIGKRLSEEYADSVHRVFYDHGKDPRREPYYCKPTPFFGECTSASALSWVDIAVVNQDTQSVELITEIEESGHEPKKIIGDIVNLFLADGIRVKGKDYAFGHLVLVLGLQVPARGEASAKATTICGKLEDLSARLGGQRITIAPIFDEELDELVSKVQDKIKLELKRLDKSRNNQLLKPE